MLDKSSQMIINSKIPIIFINSDWNLEIWNVINTTETGVDMILSSKNTNWTNETSFSCITKKWHQNIKLTKILGTINEEEGFSS